MKFSGHIVPEKRAVKFSKIVGFCFMGQRFFSDWHLLEGLGIHSSRTLVVIITDGSFRAECEKNWAKTIEKSFHRISKSIEFLFLIFIISNLVQILIFLKSSGILSRSGVVWMLLWPPVVLQRTIPRKQKRKKEMRCFSLSEQFTAPFTSLENVLLG